MPLVAVLLSGRMNKTKVETFSQHLVWAPRLEPGHLVQFYIHEEALITSLEKFVSSGAKAGDICIVIATKRHQQLLERRLKHNLAVSFARKRHRYILLDAEEVLTEVMVNKHPDRTRFIGVIGRVVAAAEQRGKPIRLFGEMVALLWRQGNAKAVLALEDLWNELTERCSFCLYCAYPMVQFDRRIHEDMFEAIIARHTHATPTFARLPTKAALPA